MGVTKGDFQVVYMWFVILHLGTELPLKGILGGIDRCRRDPETV